MRKMAKIQYGFSLLEIILAVVLASAVIVVIMNVEHGAHTKEQNDSLGSDIGLLLNKTLSQTETSPGTDSNGELTKNLSDLSTYLGVSSDFLNKLQAKGLESYTISIENGSKEDTIPGPKSGEELDEHQGRCDWLTAWVSNDSEDTWTYDGDSAIHGYWSSTSPTVIRPGEYAKVHFKSEGKVDAYFYFKSSLGNHRVGYHVTKESEDNEDSESRHAKTNGWVTQGQTFTTKMRSDIDGLCSGKGNDHDRDGQVWFTILNGATQTVTINMEFNTLKQTNSVASHGYRLIHVDRLNQLDLFFNPPITPTIDETTIQYVFNQYCAAGALSEDDNDMPEETPSACAYTSSY
jgi:hypothetical protein